jgi:hypothetical protein
MPNKMERFTQRARRILSLAQEAAEALKHNVIDTEHMLVALVREEGGVAGRVLHNLNVETKRVEELIEELSQAKAFTPISTLDLSSGTKKLLELAVDEARRMGHHYIGTEHLLLGLVRQSDSVAIEILKRLGVSPEEVRRQTRRVLQEAPVQPQSTKTKAEPQVAPPNRKPVSFPPYETSTYKLMHAAMMKVFDMIEAGKLTTTQGSELLTALQPWFTPSLGEKALLIAEFKRPENLQERRLRLVVTNIATEQIRFEMAVPLQGALDNIESVLGAVSEGFIGRLWREDVNKTNRIEVFIDEDESPSAESGDSDA